MISFTQFLLPFLLAHLGASAPLAPSLNEAATKTYSVVGEPTGPTSLRGFDPSLPFATENTHPSNIQFAPHQEADDPSGISLDFTDVDNPQPLRGSRGGTIASTNDISLEKSHPDTFAPPVTDHGAVAQMEWPMGLSHSKLGLNKAGWSRQQNVGVLPIATEMAGVDMRLEAGAYRELHCEYWFALLATVMVIRLTVE